MFGTGLCCLPHILEGFHRHLPHTRVGITTGGPHTHLIVHLKMGPGILGGKIKTQGAASSNFGSQPAAATTTTTTRANYCTGIILSNCAKKQATTNKTNKAD